jgi:hypothetical protein
MDLSLRERTPGALRAAPALRVYEVARLLLHEEADPGRVARLRDTLRRDGVVKNPPIATALAEGDAAVLDGANRVTALRELGVPHVVAQMIVYDDPQIALSTWRHYVDDAGGEPLRDRISGVAGTRAVPVSDVGEAEGLLARREAIAALIDERGAVVLRGGSDPVAIAEELRRLVALYRGRSRIHRLEAGDRETLSADYGPGTLVLFPPFEKQDILRIAERGGRLPTGITRHVIPGRALRLNTPLSWLGEPSDVAEKQALLEDGLRQRWLDHGVRYYPESTFLFDE